MPSNTDQISEQLDDVLDKFSWRNAYFVFVFLATGSVWLFAAMSIMVSSFTVGTPCYNINTKKCTSINGTIAWEFDLNGQRARLADISTSVYAIGSVIGALTLTRLADLKGRRPVVLISLFLSGLFGCLASLTPNIYLFMVARFVQGICFVGCAIDSWVLAYETVPKRLRDLSTMVFGCMWVVGYLLVSPIAYFIQSWRILLFVCSVPCVLASIGFYFLVPESFRYMVLNGQKSGLKRFIQRANQFSDQKVDIDADSWVQTYNIRHPDHLTPPSAVQFLHELFARRRLLLYTVVLSYLWLYNTFVYYGLSLFSTDLGGNTYLNYVYLGLVEIPANVGSPYLLSLLGRKFFILGAHLVAASAFLMSIFTEHSTLALILWLIGKSATVCSFNSLFVCASELFPTTIRSGCIGICEIMARVGGALAPMFHSVEGGNPVTIKIVYTVTGFIATLSTLVIPETSKIKLPDTTSELNEETRIQIASLFVEGLKCTQGSLNNGNWTVLPKNSTCLPKFNWCKKERHYESSSSVDTIDYTCATDSDCVNAIRSDKSISGFFEKSKPLSAVSVNYEYCCKTDLCNSNPNNDALSKTLTGYLILFVTLLTISTL